MTTEVVTDEDGTRVIMSGKLLEVSTECPAWLRHEPMFLTEGGRCTVDVFIPQLGPHGSVEYQREICGMPKWMHEDGGEMPEGEEAPVLNIQVVECAVCHEVLLNRLFRWTHMPQSTQTDHAPEPRPRTEVSGGLTP